MLLTAAAGHLFGKPFVQSLDLFGQFSPYGTKHDKAQRDPNEGVEHAEHPPSGGDRGYVAIT